MLWSVYRGHDSGSAFNQTSDQYLLPSVFTQPVVVVVPAGELNFCSKAHKIWSWLWSGSIYN